jgi:hypothetical protein
MADIKCPNCGTSNQAGQEICSNCHARLDAPGPPLHPGQVPTKKNTAELEPILPQWLRDARDQARKSAQDDTEDALNQPRDKKEAPVDLLAGLQAQAGDEDDEVPDWLSTITGKTGKGRKSGRDESSEVRWVELGGGTEELSEPGSKKKDSIPVGQAPMPSSGENELPPWLANVIAGQEEAKQDTLSGWLKKTDGGDQPPPPTAQPEAPKPDAAPDRDAPFPRFEKPYGEDAREERSTKPSMEQSPAVRRPEGFAPLEAGLPDWMKTQPLGPGRSQHPQEPASEELPDWLKNIDNAGPQAEISYAGDDQTEFSPADSSAGPDAAVGPAADFGLSGPSASNLAADVDTPDWLANLGSDDSVPTFSTANRSSEIPADSQAGFPEISETPDWLKNLGSQESAFTEPAAPSEPAGGNTFAEGPDWLKDLGSQEPAFPEPAAPSQPAGGNTFAEGPDWLKDLGSQEPAFPEPAAPSQPAGGNTFAEGPDWLKDLGSIPSPDASPDFSSSSTGMPAESALPASAAFAPEGGQNVFPDESLSKGDLDSLFTEMPDWLAGVAAEEPGTGALPADTNVIAPGSLPSWVEAMRPVESSVAQGGKAGDQTLETRGPLAGLNGVLPAIPFQGPTSKPKAYSIKLVASEEQRAHAALLEEVLGAETVPVPIVSQTQLASQRALRLVIASLLSILLVLVVFSGIQTFEMPSRGSISPRVQAGLDSMWAIPANAPVLVVFDYDPALAGEMETLAGPLLDQMILLKQSRLAFVSTSPAGPELAEAFFANLESRVGDYAGYEPGLGYVNLGYLPGGQNGVRAFARNPAVALPFAYNGSQPWGVEPLVNVQVLAHFAAIIVITDTAEGGRTWIEQTGSLRLSSPLVIASSAQAGPLLAPYFESGQVNLLFSGLRDSALLEQIDTDVHQILAIPGTGPGAARQYWAAYNFGLYFAVLFIVGGSLLSLFAGMRERAEAKADSV